MIKTLFPNETEVPGFTIPLRELTKEEYEQNITFNRFDDFHCEVGEDFCDQCGYIFDNLLQIFTGYLIGKYPNVGKELIEESNKKHFELLSLMNLFDEEQFYGDFADFLNFTTISKAKVNQILIQCTE